jgi:protein TonB
MHATSNYQNSGSKVTKIAIVTALHAGVVLALLNLQVIKDTVAPPPPIDVTLTVDHTIVDETVPDTPVEKTVPPLFVPFTDTVRPTENETVMATNEVPPVAPLIPVVGPHVIAPPAVVTPKPVAKDVFTVASAGNCPVPNYPANSARNGDTGTVGLALLIAPDGHVADSRVTTSSGFRELDRAAVAALSSCKFKPATTNGVPESAWGKIAYVWTLE